MRCQEPHPGDILRAARARHGLTQRRLALRAGTSQDAISRIERGAESPTLERLRSLLLVMGEEPVLSSVPIDGLRDAGRPAEIERLTPRERLLESASWNLVATQLEVAGAAAKRSARHTPRADAR